jgi:Protein of unknown function (DUF4239)
MSVAIGLTAIAGSIAAAALGLLLIRRIVPLAVLQEQHEVAGVTFAVIGGFYGIVLAFVLVASWERFERARANTEAEANALGDLYRQAAGMPDAVQSALTTDITQYLHGVIEADWPAMSNDQLSPQTQDLYLAIWRAVLDMQPQTGKDIALYQCMVQKLDDFAEARRDRLLYMQTALPPVIWNFLLVFGAITVAFTYFFGMPRLLPQLIITVALTGTVACTMFIIWEMQTPFSGAVRVPDRAFRVVLGTIPERPVERRALPRP